MHRALARIQGAASDALISRHGHRLCYIFEKSWVPKQCPYAACTLNNVANTLQIGAFAPDPFL